MIIVNPPPLGAYLFQAHLRWVWGRGLNRDVGLI